MGGGSKPASVRSSVGRGSDAHPCVAGCGPDLGHDRTDVSSNVLAAGLPFLLVGSRRCEDAVVFVLPCCWLLFGIAGFGFANRIMARFAQKVDR